PPVYVFTWTGCYVGLNVGGHWGADQITTTTTVANFGGGGAAFLDTLTPATLRPQGIIGGGQGGCNLQYSYLVAGFEVDADALAGTTTRTVTAPPNPFIATGDFLTNAAQTTFLATVRGRVGVAFDRVPLFATGGAAFATIKTTDTL